MNMRIPYLYSKIRNISDLNKNKEERHVQLELKNILSY